MPAIFKTLAAAESEIGGMSAPGKMPEGAYSVTARACQTGGRLQALADSVCAGCYALKNRYAFDTVQAAGERRLARVLAACADPAGSGQRWIDALAYILTRRRVQHFRWHDAGDLQSVVHFDLIVRVCRATPDTLHWLPTKEPRYVKRWQQVYGALPSNLIVRVSAPMVDTAPPAAPGLCTSTVHRHKAPQGAVCGASERGGKCGPCRACWDSTVPNVSYPWH